MLETLFSWTFETWYHTFITMLVFFNVLYWVVTLIGLSVFRFMERKKKTAEG